MRSRGGFFEDHGRLFHTGEQENLLDILYITPTSL